VVRVKYANLPSLVMSELRNVSDLYCTFQLAERKAY
jgi:hypothetical protein